MHAEPKFPFTLSLFNASQPLVCQQTLRFIPNKRLVVKGEWQKKRVVAKLFFTLKAEKALQREINGLRALQTAGLLTPKILYTGTDQTHKIKILIIEHIDSNYPIDQIWQPQHANSELKKRLLQAIVTDLASQHQAGLRQLDMHPNNFIIHDKGIYHIDGDAITCTANNTPLPKKASYYNLASLFSLLYPQQDHLCESLIKLYTAKRDWQYSPAIFNYVRKLQFRFRRLRIKRYLKKSCRNGSKFIKHQNSTQLRICRRKYYTPAMQKLLHNPDQVIATAEIIKAGNSSTVAKIKIDNKFMVIKRYNIKNFRHRLKRLLRTSRALKSWRNAHCLIHYGLATPKPIALLEKRFGPLRSKAYFICSYVDAHNADDYFQQTTADNKDKQRQAQAIKQYINDLAKLKIYHGDMKATNWLIGTDHVYLTDLDSMKRIHNKRRLRRALKKDRQRFLRNWHDDENLLALFADLNDVI